MDIAPAKNFRVKSGVSAVSPKDDAARAHNERDESDSAEAEIRREVRRKNGRGVFVDKTI